MDPRDGIRANSVSDIQARVRLWDLFYSVSRETIADVLDAFKERCVRTNYAFEIQDLIWRNKIKPIVDKRAEAIPTFCNYSVGEPRTDGNRTREEQWLDDWVTGAFFDGGYSLWKALRTWNKKLERNGNVILKLSRDQQGRVHVSRMLVEWADKIVDPEDYSTVLAWEFEYRTEGQSYGGPTQSVQIREYIDADVIRRYEGDKLTDEWQHGLGFIPVVHLSTGAEEDRLWGESVIEDLIEPQIGMAASSSTVRSAARWAGWPAFTGNTDRSLVDLRPGGYTFDATGGTVKALTWNSDTRALEAEEDKFLNDMYEIGRVMPSSLQWGTSEAARRTASLSGRALLVLTKDGIQYIKAICSDLEEGMAELFDKALAMAGIHTHDPASIAVTVSYPPLDLEDDVTKRENAKLIIDLYSRRLLSKNALIEALKDLNVIRLPEDTETLIAEAEQEDRTGEVPQMPERTMPFTPASNRDD